jgi:hypothetical protein
LTISDKYRFLVVQGVPYWIAWEDLLPGCSFFLKTVATSAEVRKALIPFEAYFNINLAVSQRCEFGYYGVRVWRTV